MSQSSSDISKQMESIRAKRTRRLNNLAEQTERLTDWREHVRAAPLTAFAVSVLGGAVLARGLFSNQTPQNSAPKQSFFSVNAHGKTANPTSSRRSLLGHASSLVLPIAAAIVRRQIMNAIAGGTLNQNQAAGTTHEQKQSD